MAYSIVSPGERFRPNAQKENAVSRLLDRTENIYSGDFSHFAEECSVALAINTSDQAILAGAPAAIVENTPNTEFAALTVDSPAILVAKIDGESTPRMWGVALEEIAPGSIGPVQIHGVCVFRAVAGSVANFIDVSSTGAYRYSSSGLASVLRSNHETQTAVAFIGRGSVYDGFFAVGLADGKFSVFDGGDPQSSTAGYYFFNGESRWARKATGIAPAEGWLCLKDRISGSHGDYEIVATIPSKPTVYGSDDYHPLAYIKKVGESWTFRQVSKWEFPQLWSFEDCESEE
jgi:hypothetical protein